MISIFSSDASSETAKDIPVPATKQPASSTVQHPAVSKTVLSPAAPAPEKHGIFSWLSIGKARKRLQMLETVSLGEKRFVALVQVDGRQFLIGGAPSNVGMLAELAPEETFHQVLRDATQGLNENLSAPAATAAPAPAASPASATVAVAPATQVEVTPLANARIADKATSSLPVPVPEPAFVSPALVQHTSISPLPLAEVPLPASVTPEITAAPSLPPHVAARLAEMRASALETAPAKQAIPIVPDDLSLEEPVSLSPSLLAAMQQRAKAALPQVKAQPEPEGIATICHFMPQQSLPIARELAPAPAPTPVPAPSFTFQFSPTLTSTTQAVRLSGAAIKLQGAA